MDWTVIVLICCVLGEACALSGVLIYGFTRALPRAINHGVVEARKVFAEEKEHLKALLHDIIGEYLNDVSIKAMAKDAATVLGDELGAKFGGKVAGAVNSMKRRASSDPFGMVIDLIGQAVMSKMIPVDGAVVDGSPAPLPPPSPSSGVVFTP